MKNENQKNVRIDVDLIERMKKVKKTLGIPMSEQLRRGMTIWLNRIDNEVNKQ